MLTVTRLFEFEAAHFLPDYNGKCQNLHGHTYKLEIEVSGPPKKKKSTKGMVCDFSDLKDIVQTRILNHYDHKSLNNYNGNPTAENLVKDIVASLKEWDFGHHLIRVRLWETSNSYAEWRKS